jgi:hypothetical protein
MPGTVWRLELYLSMSIETVREQSTPPIIREAWQIAWDYLDRTGQIEDERSSAVVLAQVFSRLTRQRLPPVLLLANRAISEYEKASDNPVWLV